MELEYPKPPTLTQQAQKQVNLPPQLGPGLPGLDSTPPTSHPLASTGPVIQPEISLLAKFQRRLLSHPKPRDYSPWHTLGE